MKKSSSTDHESHPPRSEESPLSERDRDTGSLASAFALVWRVLSGRRFAIPEADMPDVAQEALMRLWKWREKYQEKANRMTTAEWDSFAAKTAHNEINRFFSKRIRTNEISFDETTDIPTPAFEGNASAEMVSLVARVWQETCKLSLYRRRALLLSSPDLLIDFIQYGIPETAIIDSLEISSDEWLDISGRLPLSDEEVAGFARSSEKASDARSARRAIKKARYDARKKLGRLRK